jgi:hypothetical protein
VVVVPAAISTCPAGQLVQLTQSVAELASLSHVPLAQACFAVVPPGQ